MLLNKFLLESKYNLAPPFVIKLMRLCRVSLRLGSSWAANHHTNKYVIQVSPLICVR